MPRRNWTREELIMAMGLYFQLPFGRLNHTTKEIIDLANVIGRTSNSVSMRLCNFAACDPYIIESGRSGLPGGLSVCLPIWNEWIDKKDELFVEAERLRAEFMHSSLEKTVLGKKDRALKGEYKEAVVRQRIHQDVFRQMILGNYEYKCAVTGISLPQLLVASHIIPWAENEETRLIPENGICLSSLYDKTFDSGLMMISPDDFTIHFSEAIHEHKSEDFYSTYFKPIEGNKLLLPIEHSPKRDYLAWHRDNIYKG